MQLAVGVRLLLTIKSVTCERHHACCRRRCCELADTHALSRPRSSVHIRRYFRYWLIRGSLISARFSAVEMDVSLYAGQLIRIRYLDEVLHAVSLSVTDVTVATTVSTKLQIRNHKNIPKKIKTFKYKILQIMIKSSI